MVGDAPLSPQTLGVTDLPQRLERLRAYARHFGYEVQPLEYRLSEEERVELLSIRSDLSALRERVEDLIDQYRRTGNR